MRFGLLGELEIEGEGRSVAIGAPRQRALLALLLLNRGVPLTVDRIAADLWGDRAPATAVKTVQVYVAQLRKALGEGVVVTRGRAYLVEPAEHELDVARFEQLAAQGRQLLADGDAAGAAAKLREALALWRGPPLADFTYEEFAQAEIARLEELRLATVEARIDADLLLGRHLGAAGELEALVRAHPEREHLVGQLMVALYRSGRQTEALDAYQQVRRTLVDTLGIEPRRSLRELEKAILNQDPSLDFVLSGEEPIEATRGSKGVFVGRETEMRELHDGLRDSLAGHGRLFLLIGEPGIGKSRLAEELVDHARTRGAQILVGRCWEAGGAPAFWPWVQALRAYVHAAEPEALRAQLGVGGADLAQLLPELREILPGLPEPPALESESARFRLFDAATAFLRNASAGCPIVLVLDDLHAADEPSLLLLRFFAREIGSTHLLLLGALRNVDPIPGGPLTALLAEVTRDAAAHRLALAELSEQAVARYIELAASEIATPEIVRALYEETEGNPLFVSEMVRLLALEHPRQDGSTVRIALPPSVREVITRRLAHLSAECNRLLTLASVLGREFTLPVLAQMAGVGEDELLETLDEALVARILSDVPGDTDRLRFAHILIRDTLYEELTPARRIRLHRNAAAGIEAVCGASAGPYLAELAHHAIAGNEFASGLDYARRAGDRAATLLAYEKPRGSTNSRSAFSRPIVSGTTRIIANSNSDSETSRHGEVTSPPRRQPSCGLPSSPEALECHTSWHGPHLATADDSCGRDRGVTNVSSLCSRRRWLGLPRRTATFVPACLPVSPVVLCETPLRSVHGLSWRNRHSGSPGVRRSSDSRLHPFRADIARTGVPTHSQNGSRSQPSS